MAESGVSSQNQSAQVVGVMPDYLQVRALEIGQGLAITELDVRERQRVVVLGATLAKNLFPSESPLGQRVQVKGIGFRVIGVMAEKGDTGFSSPDEMALVPITTHQGVLFGQDHVSAIGIAVNVATAVWLLPWWWVKWARPTPPPS